MPPATGDDIYMRVQYKAIWSVSPDGAADHRQVVEPAGRNPCTMNSRYLNPDGATERRCSLCCYRATCYRGMIYMRVQYKAIWSVSPDGATDHRQVVEPVGRNPVP